MKNQSRKILAVLMALVMTVAQFSPVIANEYAPVEIENVEVEVFEQYFQQDAETEIFEQDFEQALETDFSTPPALEIADEEIVPFSIDRTLTTSDTNTLINSLITFNRTANPGVPIIFTIPQGTTVWTMGRIEIGPADNVTFRGAGTLRAQTVGTIINMTGGSLTIDGITIMGGTGTAGMASAIHVSPQGTVTMRSGNIVSNTGNSAVMLSGSPDARFEMYGGTINNNQATIAGSAGGGVNIASGTFIMRGGTISNNTAGNGGGVNIQGGSGSFVMHNGEIRNNTSTANGASSGGGGVRLAGTTTTTFTMHGGTIENNRSGRHGGGVFQSNGTMTMTGGTIRNHTLPTLTGGVTSYGGGIFVAGLNSVLNMTGGTISGNSATGRGGGIDVDWNTIAATTPQRLSIGANATISGNTSNAHRYELSAEDRATLAARFPAAVVNLFDNHQISYTRGIRVEYSELHFMVNSGSGTLTAWHNGTALASPTTVRAGQQIHFTATPAPGYRVNTWTGNDAAPVGTVFNSVVTQGGGASTAVFVNFAPAAIPAPWAVTNVLGTGTPLVTERFASSASYQDGRFTMDTRGTIFPYFSDGDGQFTQANERVAFVSQAIPYNYNFTISGYITLHDLMDGRVHPAGASNSLFAGQNTGVGFMARNRVGTGGDAQSAAYILGGVHLSTNADISNTHPTLTNARIGRLRGADGGNATAVTNIDLIGDIELGVPFPVSLTRRGNAVTIESNGVTQSWGNFQGFTTAGGEYIYVGMVNSRMALASFTDVVLEYYDPLIRTLEQLLAAIEAAAESGEPTVLELRGEFVTPYEIGIPRTANITLMGDATIHRTGAGRTIRNRGYLTILDDIRITGTSSGGVAVSNGTFTMVGGEITSNEGINGGGVSVAADAYFIMYGGKIHGNHARQAGGGVFVHDGGNFTMNGGVIANNTPGNLVSEGNFTRNDGFIEGHIHRVTTVEELRAVIAAAGEIPAIIEIYGEIVSSSEILIPPGAHITLVGDGTIRRTGGGRAIRARESTLIIDGITISGTATGTTGGVAVSDNSTVIMKSGHITANSANNGGGVNIAAGNTFIMYGGTISGNHANQQGGGVFNSGTFTLIGGTIENNTTNNVAGEFTHFGGTIGGEEAPADHLIRTLAELRAALAGASATPRVLTLGNDIPLIGETLHVRQNTDITIIGGYAIYRYDDYGTIFDITAGNLTIGTDAYNGITITGGVSEEHGGGITVRGVGIQGGTLTMNSGEIYGNTTHGNGGGVGVLAGGEFILNGGVIAGNTSLREGATPRGGGGIFVHGIGGGAHGQNNARFTMNGGVIEGNTATSGGGILAYTQAASHAFVTINDGAIRHNTATTASGGGIMADVRNGRTFVTINGGKIYGNTANNGGGIATTRGANLFMHGGVIHNNTAANRGGGVHAGGYRPTEIFVMTGGEITNNAALNGGGISLRGWDYITAASIVISPAAIIMGNSAYQAFSLSTRDALHLATVGLSPAAIALFDNHQIEHTRTFDCGYCNDEICDICTPNRDVTIIFDLQGGSLESGYAERIVTAGNVIGNLPANVVRSENGYNYRISGWFTAPNGGGVQWFAHTQVTAATTLYARWVRRPDDFQVGAVTGNGRVTSADATLLARWLVLRGDDNQTVADFCQLAADINGDGEVTPDDLILLAQWLVGHNVTHLIAK